MEKAKDASEDRMDSLVPLAVDSNISHERKEQGSDEPTAQKVPTEDVGKDTVDLPVRDEPPTPTTASRLRRNTPDVQPQALQQPPPINAPALPSPSIEHVEQSQQAHLELGDMTYIYQEVQDHCANPGTAPQPSFEEPFPSYVDPLAACLTLGEFAYYDFTQIRRPYEQYVGRQVTFPQESSNGSSSECDHEYSDEYSDIYSGWSIPYWLRLPHQQHTADLEAVDESTGATSPALHQDAGTTLFKPTQYTDFGQNNYDINSTDAVNGTSDNSMGYDPFMSNVSQGLQSAQYNPYAEEHNPLAGAGASYYGAQNTFSTPSQPLQYHLYYPLAPIRDSLQPYQRAVFDFFLPESLRENLQKRSDAARQVLASQPGVQSPSLQLYHSLVPLDTKVKSTPGIFGLPTWVWKATSRKTGNIYCLRRVEGFRLTNEDAIKAVNSWKKITHPNIVTTVEAFTTRDFNDSSLIFVHNYHPLSKTLAEHHFPTTTNRFARAMPVQEKVLWSYLVQLSSALKVIHKAKLAARCIDISKVILTDKNRIRLSACSIFDVIHFEAHRPVEELQQEDFFNLGKLILSVGTNTPPRNIQDFRPLLEQLGRSYSDELKERVGWLLWPSQTQYKTAEQLIRDLAVHIDDVFVSSTNAYDEAMNHLGRELENGRLVRLLAKLGTINERPEFDGDPNWSETEHRYTLKLFRDYVFHQVDAQGNPVLDLGHIISCLNKLDAGTEEKIYLTSRDHQSTFLVTYRELKKQIHSAFGDLQKGNTKQQQQTSRGF
ncbi:hypothetical protein FHL15_000518 [Xylaria flabelliformis]|uniref:PAN2-PAN3 deadenylation complex subunit PAN3 n=1 Tax=Xylaria flabelliformis TaxID=2512241 RepID=A0A553IE22_9PEZI|nr:hypothetical protein FHL15_000518 [Xylaria flabelliformis]